MSKYPLIVKSLFALQVPRAIFHILLFRTSLAKGVIEKDLEVWIKEYSDANLPDRPLWKALVWFLWRKREFRNLFYYRILKQSRLTGRIFMEFVKFLFPPMDSLRIRAQSIGEAFFIQHGYCTGIAAQKIGKHCWINQQVTVGYMDDSEPPIIGDNVRISAGAKVLGNITIGDNSVIGANAVVFKNVSPNCTVVGVPGYIIKRDGKRVKEKL